MAFRIDPVVRRETARISAGVLAGAAVMVFVFFLIGRFDATVFYGALLGGGVAILNFFLLGLSVQHTTGQENPQKAKNWMQLSYTLRLLLMAAVVLVGIQLPCFHWAAVVIPLIFPRIVIFLLGLIPNRKGGR